MPLPAAGRKGRPPGWPLTKQSPREKTLWAREWKRPQALMWELNGQELEVALYVRSLVAAEHPGASVASRTLIRQQQEALGLSVPGLLRNKWQIEEGSAQTGAPASRRRQATRASSRERFRVVSGGKT